MPLRCALVLVAVAFSACGSAEQERKEAEAAPAAAKTSAPNLIEGMWSDPPATAIGGLCFFSCTDVAIDRLNALLDDPKNDARPYPQLREEAQKHSRDTYLRPRLTEAALKRFPFDLAEDPGLLRCEPWGLARQFLSPHQLEIKQMGDDKVELRYGEWEARRTIYLDGRAAPAGAPPSRLGHSVGRWDGDTFIVDTTAVAANVAWLDLLTPFEHSDELRVSERYTRSEDGKMLWMTATLTDPKTLREPLVVKKPWRWAPESQITSYTDCERPVGVKTGVSRP